MSRPFALKMLHKISLSQLAVLSNLSKSYISQVKLGKRPASEKLIDALLSLRDTKLSYKKAIDLFLKSRREGISPNTIRDYKITLSKAILVLGITPTTSQINHFLKSLSCTLGGKYGYFKCIRAFYNWLYSPRAGLGFDPSKNPVTWVEAPQRPKLILP